MATIRLVIYGRPQQRGSKTPWNPRNRDGSLVIGKSGRPVIATMDSNKKSKDWMQQVRSAAAAEYSGELLTGPIQLGVVFFFQRPKAHMGSGRNANCIKDSAPEFHTQTPDLSKLIRSLEDGLTGIIWKDDKQVCCYTDDTAKHWTTTQERTVVTVTELGAT